MVLMLFIFRAFWKIRCITIINLQYFCPITNTKVEEIPIAQFVCFFIVFMILNELQNPCNN